MGMALLERSVMHHGPVFLFLGIASKVSVIAMEAGSIAPFPNPFYGRSEDATVILS